MKEETDTTRVWDEMVGRYLLFNAQSTMSVISGQNMLFNVSKMELHTKQNIHFQRVSPVGRALKKPQ